MLSWQVLVVGRLSVFQFLLPYCLRLLLTMCSGDHIFIRIVLYDLIRRDAFVPIHIVRVLFCRCSSIINMCMCLRVQGLRLLGHSSTWYEAYYVTMFSI